MFSSESLGTSLDRSNRLMAIKKRFRGRYLKGLLSENFQHSLTSALKVNFGGWKDHDSIHDLPLIDILLVMTRHNMQPSV